MRWSNRDNGPPDWVQGQSEVRTVVDPVRYYPVRVAIGDGVVIYADQEKESWELQCCSTSPSYALSFASHDGAKEWIQEQTWFALPSKKRGPVRLAVQSRGGANHETPVIFLEAS